MTDQSHEIPQDLRNLVRVVSACTLGLWAFAAGLLIGVFLFSWLTAAPPGRRPDRLDPSASPTGSADGKGRARFYSCGKNSCAAARQHCRPRSWFRRIVWWCLRRD